MGLTTHVLDTCHGRPAAGLRVTLWRQNDEGGWLAVRTVVLNADGRNPDGPLLSTRELTQGRYRLEFDVAPYFRAQGLELPEPPFLDRVTIDFGVADAEAHYHVPLLVSPWSYATYRGS